MSSRKKARSSSADTDQSGMLSALEARLAASEERAAEQDQRLQNLRAHHREQLAAKVPDKRNDDRGPER